MPEGVRRTWPLKLDCGCIVEAVGWFYNICESHSAEIDAAETGEQQLAIAQRVVDEGITANA